MVSPASDDAADASLEELRAAHAYMIANGLNTLRVRVQMDPSRVENAPRTPHTKSAFAPEIVEDETPNPGLWPVGPMFDPTNAPFDVRGLLAYVRKMGGAYAEVQIKLPRPKDTAVVAEDIDESEMPASPLGTWAFFLFDLDEVA